MRNRQEYSKRYYQAHKEEAKAWYEANKEQHKSTMKAYYQAHKKEVKATKKAYYQAHKEARKASAKAWYEANKEHYRDYQRNYMKAYSKSDVNTLGQTKNSIRKKSRQILKKTGIKIPGYQIHHCFGYDDASKFIYISKALHLKIHQYLRDNNIDAGKDHWMQIRDIVNDTDEFTYIKC